MSTTTSTSSGPFSAESYFATQPPPPTLEHDIDGVRAFLSRQAGKGRKVVLVTSGGTTVPLELNVVRFLDNFSAGTRGATSAEYFLQAGYAVIFMHRQFSLQPFSRHYSHSTNPFLDFLEIIGNDPTIGVTPSKKAHLLEILSAYKSVQNEGILHTLTFVTVNDYLWLLRAVSQELSTMKRKALYYLAAAVSDFFLPRRKMFEHKIQSGKGNLSIEMDQVPKILKPMVEEWSRDGYIVSFKLETDQTLLIPKARAALERYGHQVVIGNDLNRRKFEVVFISRKLPATPNAEGDRKAAGGEPDSGQASSTSVATWLRLDPQAVEQGKEIEEDIVAELVKRHQRWIEEESEI
ncbi:hypothetical protein E1B28_005680 [Marasmius oreades]|uniref:DNA/pantothenate metabolism flavoprotein C-terminal domain-containing protein n=1 Tax=Marasmius oreades TaxID=181124 RepID=A0A9P7S5K9_9AGAR|nr:uncharacterized protein E1B28_005680 [Marasmius oreades]KAG7094873.1 hypothetical protein E1B28_005680 [Marasmius oreades]